MSIDHQDFASPIVAGSQIVANVSGGPIPNGQSLQSPFMDVSSYDQILVVSAMPASGPNIVRVQWWTAAVGGVQVGPDNIWQNTLNNVLNIVLDPLAAFMLVRWENSSGVAQFYGGTISGLTANQEQRLIIPPQVLAFDPTAVGAGATTHANVQFPLPGEAVLCGSSALANWSIGVEAWAGSAWQQIAGMSGVAGQVLTAPAILPFADTRLFKTNPTAGAGAITASLTGTT